MLAAAGLDRLGMSDIGVTVPAEVLLPAPAQGAVGIETLVANSQVGEWLDAINHFDTARCVKAERSLLVGLNGDCRSPVAALATMEDGAITLRANIYSAGGEHIESVEAQLATPDEAEGHGRAMLERAHSDIRAIFA